MINFIKYDRFASLVNIILVISFIIFKISYIWFLIIELTFISLYLEFMIYRFYLRSKVSYNELSTIKKLLKTNFNYKDYSSIYEEEEDFELEIIGYKKLLNVVLINFLRMDKRLNIESYEYLDKGLSYFKKYSKNNKDIKNNYDLINESINIIKKYYDNNCFIKDNIRKNKLLIISLIVLVLLSFGLLIIYLINKNIVFYSGVSSGYIFILIMICLFLSEIKQRIKM